MKPSKTKAQIRAEIHSQVQQYLRQGGEVCAYEKGVSGLGQQCKLRNPFSPGPSQPSPQPRTPVLEAVKAIDARRQKSKVKTPSRRPKKILLRDDFGDPIRWVWQDAQ
ncbi:MAG: hypothetical protein OIF35_01100 [Cellvibrionaceae bacterium]|nr:hypothetical protein [Cellvibrionaceae bacterium]